MKKIVAFISLMFISLFTGCSGPKLSEADFVADWKSIDGATFRFSSDMNFTAENIPAHLIFVSTPPAPLVSGKGKWTIEKAANGNRIKLKFNQIADRTEFSLPLMVSGKGKNVRLFFWKGEEGGERYEFTKR